MHPSPAGFAAGPNGIFFVNGLRSPCCPPLAGAGSPNRLHYQTGVVKNYEPPETTPSSETHFIRSTSPACGG